MDNKTTAMENLIENAENYYRTTLELYKFKAISKLSDVISDLAIKLFLIIVLVLFLLLLEIGFAIFLIDYLDKAYYGFIIVAMINLCIGLLIFALKDKWIKTAVSNAIIQKTKVLDSI